LQDFSADSVDAAPFVSQQEPARGQPRLPLWPCRPPCRRSARRRPSKRTAVWTANAFPGDARRPVCAKSIAAAARLSRERDHDLRARMYRLPRGRVAILADGCGWSRFCRRWSCRCRSPGCGRRVDSHRRARNRRGRTSCDSPRGPAASRWLVWALS